MFLAAGHTGHEPWPKLWNFKEPSESHSKTRYPSIERIWSDDSSVKPRSGRIGLRSFVKEYSKKARIWRDDSTTDVDSDDQVHRLDTDDEVSELLKMKTLELNEDVATTIQVEKPLTTRESPRRVIVIRNIPATAGINNVLSQVYGGPLEKFVYHANPKSKKPTVELFFARPQDALEFFRFGTTTGLLVVNGKKLTLEWADATNSYSGGSQPPLTEEMFEEIHIRGCRRSLVFTSFVPGKSARKSTRLFYPDPESQLSKLNIKQIKHDFSEFGELVWLGPVLSRKLCFSLHYVDIASAIKAKAACEIPGTPFYSRYSEWSVWYGKDSADRPCPSV